MSGDARPNILFIMADQLTALAVSAYGNPVVQTPHLQALADRGVVFRNCYCNQPLCTPSRASMVSGQLPSRIDAFDNGSMLPANVPTFMHHLRLGGYQVLLSGKMHFVGPDQLHGFEKRLTPDIYPSDFGWTRSWEYAGDPPRPAPDPKDPVAVANYNPHAFGMVRALKRAGPTDWTKQLDYDEEVHFRALEQLRAFGKEHRSGGGRPWFFCVSYTHPHDPPHITPEYWDRYEGVEIDLPEDPPPGYREHRSDYWLKTYLGLDEVELTPDDVYRSRRGYYAMTSYFDDKVGDLMRELDRFGLRDNTIVIVTSDHGDMVGEHGLWFKRSVREWSSRVPLIVSSPGRYDEGRIRDEVVSLVDLYPSLLGMAGLEYEPDLPVRIDGHDFTPLLRGEQIAWPDEAFIDNFGVGMIKPIRAVVKGRFKYVYTPTLEPQLYDLENDPNEWHNLAGDPAYAAIEEELRGRVLDGWDPVAQERRILEDQRTRLFLKRALQTGLVYPWDYQPFVDASKVYSRNRRAGGTDAAKPVVTGYEGRAQ